MATGKVRLPEARFRLRAWPPVDESDGRWVPAAPRNACRAG